MNMTSDDDLTLIEDPTIPRGKARLAPAGALRMHPLDIIHLTHEGDPITQLHEACTWIATEACTQLDNLEDRYLAEMETIACVDLIPDTTKLATALAASVSGRR